MATTPARSSRVPSLVVYVKLAGCGARGGFALLLCSPADVWPAPAHLACLPRAVPQHRLTCPRRFFPPAIPGRAQVLSTFLFALELYRTPAQWGETLYAYAKDTGLVNAVCTMYELTESEEVEGQPFHNLDQEVLVKALKTLEVQKKAEIFGSNEGVKFF